MSTTTILDCGHEPTMNEGIGTGMARYTDEDGNATTLCYGCAWVMTMDQIVMCGVAGNPLKLPVLYMSRDGQFITTWDGQRVGKVTHHGKRHVFADPGKDARHHIDVRIEYGADVVHAYGTGAPGMYCLLTRRKSDVPTLSFVIRSTSDLSMYWSNEFGWTTRDQADVWSETDKRYLNLPMGGRWVRS